MDVNDALPSVDERTILTEGEIELKGRVLPASNLTFYGEVAHDGGRIECVYKPVSGERPLWDFPDGTLAGREVATYLVSEAGGWHVVPTTVMREGPFGPGMVQVWVETDDERELVDVCAPDEVPRGWLPVLRARGSRGEPALLVHADEPELRAMAALDVVTNNADRKGGHVLAGEDGAIYGVDHGLCFHVEDKLRTVLWGWVGRPLPPEVLERVRRLRSALSGNGGRPGLCEELSEHLTRAETAALSARVDALLAERCYPGPSGFGPAIPWPAF